MTKEKHGLPPNFALRFLRWFCPAQLLESVEGDLLEQFYSDIAEYGLRSAKRKYFLNVFRFFRPGIILRNKFSVHSMNTIMIANHAKLAVRNISKRKLHSFINAFGLSIAIAFCVLIYLFILDEQSFDKFHEYRERIVMVTGKTFEKSLFESGEKEPYRYSAGVPAKLAEVIADELPEVAQVTRLSRNDEIMQYGDKIFMQETWYVDSGFFQMFSFPILEGSINKIFRTGNEAVITPQVALKYFGTTDAIGKIFLLGSPNPFAYVVRAIIERPGPNSSLDFQVLLPIANRHTFGRARENWANFSFPTFVMLHDKASMSSFNANLAKLTTKYMADTHKQIREQHNLPDDLMVGAFEYTPLASLHMDTRIRWTRSSDPLYTYVLASLGLLILIIASINYVSLALTTSVSRRVEVGIRKVVGAARLQLVYQFGVESIFLSLISMAFGMGLVYLFLPSFNEFTNKEIQLDAFNTPTILSFSFVISIFIGVLAGLYPAVFLSGFRPAQVLKGRFTSRLQAGFTKPLVILQFALSTFLIISAVIIFRQMKYVTTKDLGYSEDPILIIPTHAGWSKETDKLVECFRNKLDGLPGIVGIAGTSGSFSRRRVWFTYTVQGEVKTSYVYRVDPFYIDLLSIELIEGRNFDGRIASDSNAVIVNEALVKDMGWKDPLNEYLNWKDDSVGPGSKVIGIVKDYHFLSLENEIVPMLLTMDEKTAGYLLTMMIKIEKSDVPQTLARVRKVWDELNPDKPFEYSFLAEDVASQYDRHYRWMKISSLSTAFAILIAALGLFGLAGINAINKTKEIGIRKVLGASLGNIFLLLNKQYVWMAFIAFAIAAPFSWYFMNQWIQAFKFRIEIGWELFVVSMVSALALAIITVSYHGIRAASVNPAETLKHE
jgi:putative ABC transport system permease protein